MRLKTVMRGLGVTLLLGFSACVFSQIYLHEDYSSRMPTSPRPESGRVYRIMVNHGAVRYVTSEELARAHFVLNTLQWPEVILFTTLVVLRFRYKDL
jgi:hypothetical protein